MTEAVAFRDQLLKADLLVDSGVAGLYHRTAAFEHVALGVEACVVAAGRHLEMQRLYFPPLVARSTLITSGYVGSFPDLIGAVSSFSGSTSQGAEVTRRAEADGDWDELLSPTEVSLCSASCHNLYPIVARAAVPADGLSFEVHATCFRHEPSEDPARMQSFRQVEYVFVGSPDDALGHRDRWLARGLELNRALGLDVAEEVANDPFFGRIGQLLAAGQREKALKLEMVAPISSTTPGAIGSANYHEDHFGEAFGLRLVDASTAHSACVSFGIERTTLALFHLHGLDTAAWPRDVRDLLTLDAPRGGWARA